MTGPEIMALKAVSLPKIAKSSDSSTLMSFFCGPTPFPSSLSILEPPGDSNILTSTAHWKAILDPQEMALSQIK